VSEVGFAVGADCAAGTEDGTKDPADPGSLTVSPAVVSSIRLSASGRVDKASRDDSAPGCDGVEEGFGADAEEETAGLAAA
jgi:hypothetical protein